MVEQSGPYVQSPDDLSTPAAFVQPAERVARAVVRCLRHPRPEVWTSTGALLGAGLLTVFPRLFDVVMRPRAKSSP
jgi:hypothetical protein